jgi:hypothetical protein
MQFPYEVEYQEYNNTGVNKFDRILIDLKNEI